VLESDLVKQPPTNKFLGLPFSALARDKVGVAQAMNTVVLGALSYLLPFINQALMRKSLESVLAPKIRAVNVKAFNLGHRLARREWGDDAGQVWRVEDSEHE
jgi:2-oxoglutarate ferredoxin oxidoreductase subunit gamma